MAGTQGPGSPPRQGGKLSGIFSSQSVVRYGTGTTMRRSIQKTYWSVEELEDSVIEIQPLNRNYVPSGPKRQLSMDDFLAKFSPEPEFYMGMVYPRLQELKESIERGEDHRAKKELYSAEFEFANATSIDEENVRANFGLGLTYLDRGETSKANDIFERLVRLEATFAPEHKHLFNDFGISLRKNRMYTQALDYYNRALELAKNDENLHVNIARAYFEKGERDKAQEHLGQALQLKPDHAEARQFQDYLSRKRAQLDDRASSRREGV